MKKISLFIIITFLISNLSVFAENKNPEIDYSLMKAPLPEITEVNEIEYIPEIIEAQSISLFSMSDSNEKYIYDLFEATLSPENLVNRNIALISNGYYVDTGVYIDFNREDYSGDLNTQINTIKKEISRIYSDFLADNPEYFYLTPKNMAFYLRYSDTVIQVKIMPLIGYEMPDFDGSKKALAEFVTKYDSLMGEINRIKDEIYFEGMTDLDKLLLAHDYITDHCAYYLIETDGSVDYGDGYSYTSYGILVNKKGVCQGYAYAYPALLKALGYDIENIKQIKSDELNHMWNLVKLDNKWYHIDATWDDPTVKVDNKYDMNNYDYQRTLHDYFLISNDKNIELRTAGKEITFTTEVLGEDEDFELNAEYHDYESGTIFNMTDKPGHHLQGVFTHKNGKYHMKTGKLYLNVANSIEFIFDSLKTSDYVMSQPFELIKNEDNSYRYETIERISDLKNKNLHVKCCGVRQTTDTDHDESFYACFYDEKGMFVGATLFSQQVKLNDDVKFKLTNIPENAYTFKLLCIEPTTFSPISNPSVIEN